MKAGYTLYAPNEFAKWHIHKPLSFFERTDVKELTEEERHEEEATFKRIRRTILGDKEFRNQYDQKYGIDLLGRRATVLPGSIFGTNLDPFYFFTENQLINNGLKRVDHAGRSLAYVDY